MEEARVGFDRLLATVTFGRSQNKSLNLWSGEIRLAQEQGSRKQKGTSIFSWAKHIWRISFPFFLNITKKTRNIFFFFSIAFWKGLSSASLLHLAVGTMGEKVLWTWANAQMNLQFQFHLFKFILFLSFLGFPEACIFFLVYVQWLLLSSPLLCLHNSIFPLMFCALTSEAPHLLQMRCFCIKREEHNHWREKKSSSSKK